MRILAIVLGLSGCFVPPTQTPGDRLLETAKGYAERLRWGKADELIDFMPPSRRRAFLDRHDRAREEIELTEYEVTRAELGKESDTAMVRMIFTWHAKDEWVVHKTTVEQQWSRKGDQWWVLSERFVAGQPHPLFTPTQPQEKRGDT